MNKTSKTLSAVGSLLIVVSPFIFWTPLLNFSGLVGTILFLVGLHGIASYLNKKEIFSEALKGIVILIVGTIVLSLIFIVVVAIGIAGIAGSLSSMMFSTEEENIENLINLFLSLFYSAGPVVLAVVVLFVIAFWILMIIYGLKMSKASDMLNDSFSNLRFKGASILFKLGGWLSIIIVGFVLVWIAWLLYTIDFFSLPES